MKPIKILDKGYVELIDSMGDDIKIAKYAGISYDKTMTNDPERQCALAEKRIKQLLTSTPPHMSPFESAELMFLIKCPISVDRHIVRHRTAWRNEVSLRRVDASNVDIYSPENFGLTDFNNIYPNLTAGALLQDSYKLSQRTYKALKEKGVKKETARLALPLSMYTKYYWKIDLRNLMNFFIQRLASDSQWETQQYASAIFKLTKSLFPVTIKYFKQTFLKGPKYSENIKWEKW